MTEDTQEQEQKKSAARPIGHVSEFASFGKRSEVQTSRLPDTKRSKHPEWEQQTIYLPPALKQWLKVYSAQTHVEISEIVMLAVKEYKEQHS